jgi:hypothetical protein
LVTRSSEPVRVLAVLSVFISVWSHGHNTYCILVPSKVVTDQMTVLIKF